MEFSIKFDTVMLEWPIIYIEGSQVTISKKSCISFSQDQVCLSKTVHFTIVGISSPQRFKTYLFAILCISNCYNTCKK